ncbi:MAG: hypothetical protein H7A35_11850 [Planctomycetales bacterium]|nr:hypothetical protein [bacterium]UNM07551.1 MAG: hypothetical protein H7A35_11850 [Planctomycetales bacterium]
MAARRRRILFLLLGCCLLLAGCPAADHETDAANRGTVSTAGSQPRHVASSPFQLEAFPLPEGQLLGEGRVLASQPNAFAGNDVSADPGQASLVQFRPRGLDPVLNIPHKLSGTLRVCMFFPDNRVMLSQSAAGGEQPRVLVVDTDTGAELDVTPANLGPLWDGSAALPLVAWTGKHGLCIHATGQRANELVLWQGHNRLEEVQKLPAVVATGYRMLDEGVQFLAVNAGLELLAFDEVQGRMLPDPDGLDLAAAIVNAAGTDQDAPVSFACAGEIAVLQTRDGSHWAVVGSEDREDYIEVHDASGETPEGRRRVPGPGDLLGGSEAQRLRREGAQQDPSIINEGFVVPLNADHVGIFDLVYQRLVVIGVAD